MNTGKGFTKSKLIAVVVATLVVIALVVTMVFALKGCQDNKPTQGGASQTDTSSEDTEDTSESDSDETSKPADVSKPEAEAFTVTFKDFDGTVLNTQKVKKGKGATAPDEPKRENFKFAGWDKPFDKVTSNLVVTATYTTNKTIIYAEHVSVNKDAGEVKMNIRVLNNTGIMGAVLKVSVDDKALGFKEAAKTEYPALTLTSPGSQATASPYTFMLDALELSNKDMTDGTLFTITFKIKDTAAVGKYDIKLSYDKGAIFDKAYKDPKVCLENGTITIK